MAEKVRFFEGKKFLWDGEEYDSEKKAKSVEQEYSGKGFEVRVWPEDGKVLLYTRRVVTEVVVDEGG
ncbi:MAG: hypothetical protein AMJ75_00800 [Phycisphaerae bacterium SM1_79]|nr:MAG: hypothetical protein AMJ75_00800 [Phycisphaerae bacterium SM1_79]